MIDDGINISDAPPGFTRPESPPAAPIVSKYTPGPWLYRGKSDSVHTQCDTHPYGKQIFRFHAGPYEEDQPSDADLALILVSPQLLLALEDAVTIFRGLIDVVPLLRERVEAYDNLIAKARGDQ